MIRKLSHVSIFVLDQERALAFYTQKLGFEVRTDSKMGDFRWLTVGPKDQPDIEIIMLPPTPGPMLDPTIAKQLNELVAKGAICPRAFETDDVRGDYGEMKKRALASKARPPNGITGSK